VTGRGRFFAFILALLAVPPAAAAPPPAILPVEGLAMHGQPKYQPGFTHFDYVDPDAPKGGTLRLAAIGSIFDSLNPFILKGVPAAGSTLPFETLLVQSADEPYSEYGLIAQTVEVPPDRSWAIFTLRPQARWWDGTPITADDVVFSFNILKTRGAPQYRLYYQAVTKVETLGPRKVEFFFKSGDDREMPLIVGQMPILPARYWRNRSFDQTTLTPPMGSGPYRVEHVDPGRSITYERVRNYWGRDLPVQRGQYNFDHIRFDYYRDSTVAMEAFKAGEYDIRIENIAKKWVTGYQDWAALKDGLGRMVAFPNQRPAGMQAFAFNIRRPLFQDRRVREALSYAFDFRWTNEHLFYGQYTRTQSYFANSDLAATGLPGPLELKLLEPLKAEIPPEVFTRVFHTPTTDGSGDDRANLLKALALLQSAGWRVEHGILMKDGRPFRFQILLAMPEFERVVLPFIRNLKRLGIEAGVRTVDTAQYKNRVDHFNFDMIVQQWPQSPSPGNEQWSYWSSRAAGEVGSDNVVGIRNPAVDALIAKLVAAPDRRHLVAATRALDRVLLWNYYVIPQWYVGVDRVAFWNKFGMPKVIPAQGVNFYNWWIDPEKPANRPGAMGASGPGASRAARRFVWVLAGIVLLIVARRLLRRRE
jgi:microcin C transport system substrate-binding protein